MKRTTFSLDVVGRGSFCLLPAEAQALYFQMSLFADDAGAYEHGSLIIGGYGDEALEALINAGFVIKLDDIYIITHFVKNNTLRHLHLSRSHYRDIIARELLLSEDGVYKVKNPVKTVEKPVVKTAKKAQENATESSLAVEVLGYLNQRTGRSYSTKTAAYMRLINGRISEGHLLEDFIAVIDSKVQEWGKDQKMSKYLQPSTLFAPSHFDEYLQNAKKGAPALKFAAKTNDTAGVHGRDLFGL